MMYPVAGQRHGVGHRRPKQRQVVAGGLFFGLAGGPFPGHFDSAIEEALGVERRLAA